METNYLRTILNILEEGSYQKAAKRMGCSQSTVTFHVQQVEKELSVCFFEKVGRNMVLTSEGRDIIPHIRAILEEVDQLHRYGKDDASKCEILRIGVPDEVFCYGFEYVLDAFRRKAPNVSIIARPMKCHSIREGIIRNELDVGIHCDIGGYPDFVSEEKVTHFRPKTVVSAEIKDTDYITPDQKKTIPVMTSDSDSVHMRRFVRYLEDRRISPSDIIELCSTESVLINVMKGLCVACLPDITVAEGLESGKFRELRTKMDKSPIDVIFACKTNKKEWDLIALLRETVRQVLER